MEALHSTAPPPPPPPPEAGRLRRLNDASREVHAAVSADQVLRSLVDQACRLVPSRHGVARLTDTERSSDVPAASTTRDLSDAAPMRAADLRLQAEVCRTNQPIRLTRATFGDAATWNRIMAAHGRSTRAGGWLAVPLVAADGRNLGVVQLADKLEGEFDEADEASLVQLAEVAAIALENARLGETVAAARGRVSWAARIERLQAAELRAVIEAMGEAVLVCDASGAVKLANPAADAMFAGRPVRTAADLLDRFELPGGGLDPARGPVELRTRGAPSCWIELRSYPVHPPAGPDQGDARGAGTIFVLREVTQARDARSQREAFLGILSHELRTPITTIYAGSKVLARDEGINGATRGELTADISSEAERLYRLVEDLLVMTRAERGVLEFNAEPILLHRLAADAVRLEASHWPDVTFDVADPGDLPAVAGDRAYVEQVVRNLLSNAARYGPPAGAVVRVELERDDEGVALHVLDRGRGFGETDPGDLFDLFQRSPATAAQLSGAGIGLFVCRRLVQSMGGRIWAHPRPGGGSEFGFSLPSWPED